MLFRLEEDAGANVRCWVVPDNPSMEPSLYVVVDGRERYLIPTNEHRPDIAAHGVHRTGRCGFILDETICPGLAPDVDLECYDSVSNLLVYRRRKPEHLEAKLFHLETQTSPNYPLVQEVSRRVQMSYGSAEFIPEETIRTILGISSTNSVFLSGALAYRRYESFIRSNELLRTIVLGNPYRELAARLLRLKSLHRAGASNGGWRSLGQETLVADFAEIEIRDSGALARGLRTITPESYYLLSNPTIRQLVAHAADESIGDHMVAVALGMLADFDVVGFDDDLDTFAWHIEARIGAEGMTREPAMDPPGLDEVLAAVMGCRPAQELVRLDLALNDLARQATVRAESMDAPGTLG
jgi:hypothetical protein